VILDPDFLDHWKTRMLVDLLGGDECAPRKSLMENLATACYSCNRSKGAKTIEEWGGINGR